MRLIKINGLLLLLISIIGCIQNADQRIENQKIIKLVANRMNSLTKPIAPPPPPPPIGYQGEKIVHVTSSEARCDSVYVDTRSKTIKWQEHEYYDYDLYKPLLDSLLTLKESIVFNKEDLENELINYPKLKTNRRNNDDCAISIYPMIKISEDQYYLIFTYSGENEIYNSPIIYSIIKEGQSDKWKMLLKEEFGSHYRI